MERDAGGPLPGRGCRRPEGGRGVAGLGEVPVPIVMSQRPNPPTNGYFCILFFFKWSEKVKQRMENFFNCAETSIIGDLEKEELRVLNDL